MLFDESFFSTLSLFNSRKLAIQKFAPRDGNTVKMYCCGPTVYNYAHIGNLRAYVVQDILRRTLLSIGHSLQHVMNITDVGHLTGDSDEGVDKMLLSAKSEAKSVFEIAAFYTKAFFSDCEKLKIKKPEVICSASEHITEIQSLIAKIESAGFSYLRNGNLYFNTAKFESYGSLAGLDILDKNSLLSRTGIDIAKKNQCDFVLWFANGKFSDQVLQWDSPWGKGYPGWHIECSAMAMEYLGTQIDIHCGGVDHRSIHHPNEIAQSESIMQENDRPWVNFWLHNEFVLLNRSQLYKSHRPELDSETSPLGNTGEKISKSKGNIILLDDLQRLGFSPLDYRYFLLNSHYRSQLHFHLEALEGMQKSRNRLKQSIYDLYLLVQDHSQNILLLLNDRGFIRDTVINIQSGVEASAIYRDFYAALLHDLNTARALASMWLVVKSESFDQKQKLLFFIFAESLLQLGLFENIELSGEEQRSELIKEDLPLLVRDLLQQRNEARKSSNYILADSLRANLLDMGYELLDTKNQTILKKKH